MWAYANQMAILNKKRDSHAKDLFSETKYMYMSHYIDIKGGVKYFVDKDISNDVYYSAWITDDDRNAYENYLNGTKRAAQALEASKLVCLLFEMGDVVKSAVDLRKLKDMRVVLGHIENLAGAGDEVTDIVQSVVKLKKLSTDTLKDENYDEFTSKKAGDVICAIVVAVGTGGVGGLLKEVALKTYSIYSYAIKDLFDRVWWISLLYTNGLRVSNRAMRYYGL